MHKINCWDRTDARDTNCQSQLGLPFWDLVGAPAYGLTTFLFPRGANDHVSLESKQRNIWECFPAPSLFSYNQRGKSKN